ncbi:unnamed protein product [Colias eurytheme]|nr:unnamed protein product [Colias eurytheme]
MMTAVSSAPSNGPQDVYDAKGAAGKVGARRGAVASGGAGDGDGEARERGTAARRPDDTTHHQPRRGGTHINAHSY